MLTTEKIRASEIVDACVHELIAPLMAIQANAQLLQDEISGSLGVEQHAQVATILRGVTRLERLLCRMRDHAELEAPERRRPEKAILSLTEFLRGAIAGVGGTWEISAQEGDLHVSVESERVTRVMRDLVELAGKEAKRALVTIGSAAGSATVDLDLEGVAFPGELAHLFDPVSDLGGWALARSLGTGAGLLGPVLRASGGSFTHALHGSPGAEGVRLRMTLPLADGPRAETRAQPSAAAR